MKIGSCRKDLFMNDLNEVNAILKRIINGVAIAVKKLTAIEKRMLNTTIDKEFAELNTTSTFVKAKANAFEIEKAMSMVAGTARSMGITIDGEKPF